MEEIGDDAARGRVGGGGRIRVGGLGAGGVGVGVGVGQGKEVREIEDAEKCQRDGDKKKRLGRGGLRPDGHVGMDVIGGVGDGDVYWGGGGGVGIRGGMNV